MALFKVPLSRIRVLWFQLLLNYRVYVWLPLLYVFIKVIVQDELTNLKSYVLHKLPMDEGIIYVREKVLFLTLVYFAAR